MPDNGRGFSFLRQLVLPVTTLFMVIVTDKTLRVTGLSLLDPCRPHTLYLSVYRSIDAESGSGSPLPGFCISMLFAVFL